METPVAASTTIVASGNGDPHDVAVHPVPTPDQITALAPDAASLKAGRGLASARQWSELGRDDAGLWGLAHGSGAQPYQTQVALADLATKCTCPSRKFPCKHALGLLLMAAGAPMAAAAPPAWVLEWRASREQRAEQQRARAERKAEAPAADPAARVQRRERRDARIDAGVELLGAWLRDLVRTGLAAEAAQQEASWRAIEKRMVDAQAPGLASRLARVGERVRRGAEHAERAMDDLGALHALLAAWTRFDELDAGRREALEQAIGIPVPAETVLAGAGVADAWWVVGRTSSERDRIVSTRTWLRGAASGRWAFVLQSAPVHQRAPDALPFGAALRGELCFHAGAAPLRALFRGTPAAGAAEPPRPGTFAEALQRHADALAAEPWRAQTPLLANAQPGAHFGQPVLADDTGASLPWQPRAAVHALVDAVCGGQPRPLSALWDGHQLEALAVHDGADWLDLAGGGA